MVRLERGCTLKLTKEIPLKMFWFQKNVSRFQKFGEIRMKIDYYFRRELNIWGKYERKSIIYFILVKLKNLGERLT